ncbi:hypothetical protein U5U50_01180 [Mycoplasma sp. 888]|uniref:hypothetical protein n=1 Tax=Mycoplasma sp. 888 TaxID=3108483 RepID=UPI002D77B199|nr:hypothetical protein [Mycoplasma sp. 888]WRQ25994.1 hypothetical protein U5U50_01180 [Mycoplasma sp. 888]
MQVISIKKNYFQSQHELQIQQKQASEVINKIKSLNFDGSSYLGFDDIALNFGLNGVDKIIQFCNNLYSTNISKLIIWTSKTIELSIKAAMEFIFGQIDINKDKKIELIFINSSIPINKIEQLIQTFKNGIGDNVGFMFLNETGNSDYENEWISYITNIFEQHSNEFMVKNHMFYVGSKTNFSNLSKFKFASNNILFVSNDVHPEYSVLSEIGLLIMSLQGINIQKVIDGYVEASKNILNPDVYFNKALELALLINESVLKNKEDGFANIFVSYDLFLNNYFAWFANQFNNTTKQIKTISTSINFPRQIATYTQPLLSGKGNKFVTFGLIKQRFFDYQLSSNLENDDLIDRFQNLSINQIKDETYQTFVNYLSSFNNEVNSITIEIANNFEETLGQLISLLYWSRIFYCVLNSLNPFAN